MVVEHDHVLGVVTAEQVGVPAPPGGRALEDSPARARRRSSPYAGGPPPPLAPGGAVVLGEGQTPCIWTGDVFADLAHGLFHLDTQGSHLPLRRHRLEDEGGRRRGP